MLADEALSIGASRDGRPIPVESNLVGLVLVPLRLIRISLAISQVRPSSLRDIKRKELPTWWVTGAVPVAGHQESWAPGSWSLMAVQ